MPAPLNPAILDPEHTGPTFVAAPWTDDQVANLNWHQTARLFHPFTCGRREHHPDNEGVLAAEPDGWVCPANGCGYQQGWAHPHMTKPPTQAMVAAEAQRARMRALAAKPRPCLLHEDIHGGHLIECMGAYARWLADHRPLVGQAARDAYALEVEQRILDQLVRQHAPAHRINPALSK
jgi:hypothetical protein